MNRLIAGAVVLVLLVSGVWFGMHEIRAAGRREAEAENRAQALQNGLAATQAALDKWKAAAAKEEAEKARQAALAAQREEARVAAEQRADEAMQMYQEAMSHEPVTSCARQRVPAAVDRLLSGAAGPTASGDRGAEDRQAVPAR